MTPAAGWIFHPEPDSTDPWSALHAAERYLRDHGYVTGPMQGPAPIGVIEATIADAVAKWRNLDTFERRALAATIVPIGPTFRDGAAQIRWIREPVLSAPVPA